MRENDYTNHFNSNSDNNTYYNRPPQKPKIPWFKIFLISLIAGILGSLIILGLSVTFSKIGSNFSNQSGSEVNVANQQKGGNLLDGQSKNFKSVNEMIHETSPSIVGVINEQKATNLEDLLRGKSTEAEPTGVGSGVIYQKDGKNAFIVTNNHVIDGATSIKVQLHNDKQVSAELIGTDVLTDIAVLKIKDNNDTKAISFADSSKVKTGDTVFAMGNPLGLEFANTVTSGIISSSERTIDADTAQGSHKVTVLQTDAAINPGNSGGALVDINGNLVGINSMKISAPQVEGIGFAIPSNEVKTIIAQLVKDGEVKRPSIGIGMINVADIPDYYKNDKDLDSGVYVAEVQRSGIDLKKGDIITKIDDQNVENDSELRSYLYKEKKPGDQVTFTVNRNGQNEKVQVTLTETDNQSLNSP
ncbi:S1C family serine protease [Staphylococcus canis]|uniref:Serine protease HtrA-like n=1 Tax=Staphylococcus canis TaxID=2724942 RepID=A0ABS0T680_9STAP|nr:S1C family serine protease [Staphylococcus canis]MBI5974253.1 serine protease [Staphylococcus canis]